MYIQEGSNSMTGSMVVVEAALPQVLTGKHI